MRDMRGQIFGIENRACQGLGVWKRRRAERELLHGYSLPGKSSRAPSADQTWLRTGVPTILTPSPFFGVQKDASLVRTRSDEGG